MAEVFKQGVVEFKDGVNAKKWAIVELSLNNDTLSIVPSDRSFTDVSVKLREGDEIKQKVKKGDASVITISSPCKNFKEFSIKATAEEETQSWFNELENCFKYLSPTVYGVDLTFLAKKDRFRTGNPTRVATILTDFTNSLDRHKDTEGIFRLSSKLDDVNQLKARIDSGEQIDFNSMDTILVANMLKTLIRELPEPLLTFDRYEQFLKATRTESIQDSDNMIKRLVQGLPSTHYATLSFLMNFLRTVAELQSKNLMGAVNLAVCFGPTILKPREETLQTMAYNDQVNNVCKSMIERTAFFFDGKPVKLTPEQEAIVNVPNARPPSPVNNSSAAPNSASSQSKRKSLGPAAANALVANLNSVSSGSMFLPPKLSKITGTNMSASTPNLMAAAKTPASPTSERADKKEKKEKKDKKEKKGEGESKEVKEAAPVAFSPPPMKRMGSMQLGAAMDLGQLQGGLARMAARKTVQLNGPIVFPEEESSTSPTGARRNSSGSNNKPDPKVFAPDPSILKPQPATVSAASTSSGNRGSINNETFTPPTSSRSPNSSYQKLPGMNSPQTDRKSLEPSASAPNNAAIQSQIAAAVAAKMSQGPLSSSAGRLPVPPSDARKSLEPTGQPASNPPQLNTNLSTSAGKLPVSPSEARKSMEPASKPTGNRGSVDTTVAPNQAPTKLNQGHLSTSAGKLQSSPSEARKSMEPGPKPAANRGSVDTTVSSPPVPHHQSSAKQLPVPPTDARKSLEPTTSPRPSANRGSVDTTTSATPAKAPVLNSPVEIRKVETAAVPTSPQVNKPRPTRPVSMMTTPVNPIIAAAELPPPIALPGAVEQPRRVSAPTATETEPQPQMAPRRTLDAEPQPQLGPRRQLEAPSPTGPPPALFTPALPPSSPPLGPPAPLAPPPTFANAPVPAPVQKMPPPSLNNLPSQFSSSSPNLRTPTSSNVPPPLNIAVPNIPPPVTNPSMPPPSSPGVRRSIITTPVAAPVQPAAPESPKAGFGDRSNRVSLNMNTAFTNDLAAKLGAMAKAPVKKN